ncbi:MAG: hypothetical protein IJ651_04800 [Bacteroidales bacterium]|nr:hypothetical protein [Bacteroidales bacterium]
MRKMFCAMVLWLPSLVVAAQEEDVLRAALYLSGASSAEEIPVGWTDQLEGLPAVRINSPNLRSGILLSDYQVASVKDYRASAGDILSWEELAHVDGFSQEAVVALKPFLSLYSSRLPGASDTVKVKGTVMVRGTLSSAGVKARVTGQSWRAGGAWRGKDGTFHASAEGRAGRWVLGDFNLRFGQGLALWSGFSMTSLSTVDAFLWRPNGISPAWSYLSSALNRGVAYEYSAPCWRGSVFATLDGLFGSHGEWLGRYGQIGTTAVWSRSAGLSVSLDGRLNWRGTDSAFEVAWKPGSLAFKSAFRCQVGDGGKLAVQGRAVPSRFSGKKHGEYALAAGGSYRSGRWVPLHGRSGFGSSIPAHEISLTVEAALLPVPSADPGRLQVRVYGNWKWQLSGLWSLAFRFTERYRNYEPSRTGLRADLHLGAGPWLSVWRLEGVHCEGLGGLGYWEGGYKDDTLAGYLRLTGFFIDRWADRIYSYERDAAGTFSVPAYAGRGCAISLVGSWKHRFRHCTLRATLRSALSYRAGRPLAPTLNAQLQADW